eukprot:gene38522-47571_t
MSLPLGPAARGDWTRRIADAGLALIAQQWETVFHPQFDAHKAALAELLHNACAARPVLVNTHTGKDFYSQAQNLELIALADAISQEHGVPIVHEIHRSRFSGHPMLLLPYLAQLPQLQLTADLSHWCCACESLLDDQPETPAPYGAWASPISAALVAAGATPLSSLALGADGDIYWLAGRASEAGRQTLQRRHGARTDEITPLPLNVRTRVHEYGGGAYAVHGDTVYFSHFADNRLYCRSGEAEAAPFTASGRQRFADFVVDPAHARLIAVREQHQDDLAAPGAPHHQPVNTLCAVAFDGAETVLASGHDFYSSPRLSPDGRMLAWLTWDHP